MEVGSLGEVEAGLQYGDRVWFWLGDKGGLQAYSWHLHKVYVGPFRMIPSATVSWVYG